MDISQLEILCLNMSNGRAVMNSGKHEDDDVELKISTKYPSAKSPEDAILVHRERHR